MDLLSDAEERRISENLEVSLMHGGESKFLEVLAALLEHGAHPLRKMGASPRTALDLLPRKHHVKGTRAYKLLREAMVKHKMNLNDEL